MKKLILLMLLAFSINAIAQQTRIIPVNGDAGIFRTNVAKNTLIFDIENNFLYKLNAYTIAGTSLADASKVVVSAGNSFLELDPIWLSDKPNYVSSTFLNSQNYLTDFTELDPVWLSDKPNYVTSSWLTSQNYLTNFTETDPLWTSEKSNYVTSSWLTSQNYLTNFSETDPVWLIDKPNFATTEWVNNQNFLGGDNINARDSVTINGSIDTLTMKLDYGAKNLIVNAGTLINGAVTNTTVDSSVTIINGGGYAVQDELRMLTPLSYDATTFNFDTLNFSNNTFLSYEIDMMCIADNAGSFMLFRLIYKLDVVLEDGVKSYMFSDTEYPTRTNTNMQIGLFSPNSESLILQILGMPTAVTSVKALLQITEREVSL